MNKAKEAAPPDHQFSGEKTGQEGKQLFEVLGKRFIQHVNVCMNGMMVAHRFMTAFQLRCMKSFLLSCISIGSGPLLFVAAGKMLNNMGTGDCN